VDVPAGEYSVGCRPERNRECFDDERPAHQVAIRSFAIMRHEVTVADYDACVRSGACPAPRAGSGCTSGRAGAERQPITCVDWNGARAFCEHQGLRLPTEAEWEIAALGPDHGDFPWGSEPASCPRTVVGNERGPGCGADRPADVGSFAGDRSWLGAMDFGGNVREWTATDYAPYAGGVAVAGSRGKVNRGGSYLMASGQVSTGHTRGADPPSVARPDLGFRCAADR
jgi:formylglycine-generating enzyme required for sulfatase activity